MIGAIERLSDDTLLAGIFIHTHACLLKLTTSERRMMDRHALDADVDREHSPGGGFIQ